MSEGPKPPTTEETINTALKDIYGLERIDSVVIAGLMLDEEGFRSVGKALGSARAKIRLTALMISNLKDEIKIPLRDLLTLIEADTITLRINANKQDTEKGVSGFTFSVTGS